jgi:hypothetical protein
LPAFPQFESSQMLSRAVGEYRSDPFRNRYNVSQQPVMSVNLTAERSASSARGAGMSLSTGR